MPSAVTEKETVPRAPCGLLAPSVASSALDAPESFRAFGASGTSAASSTASSLALSATDTHSTCFSIVTSRPSAFPEASVGAGTFRRIATGASRSGSMESGRDSGSEASADWPASADVLNPSGPSQEAQDTDTVIRSSAGEPSLPNDIVLFPLKATGPVFRPMPSTCARTAYPAKDDSELTPGVGTVPDALCPSEET